MSHTYNLSHTYLSHIPHCKAPGPTSVALSIGLCTVQLECETSCYCLALIQVTPGIVFQQVGVDYAGPVRLRAGHVRKPTFLKAYIGVFVSFTIKAVHLELISDLTSASFIACLRRFIARRGKPHTIWSDHGSNFVGAQGELMELAAFLDEQQKKGEISDFCSSQMIQWTYIPEWAPHFGGLWESAVKSTKTHLKRILGEAKLTFEEYSTVLCQVEACLNSRPLVPVDSDEDGMEALTPGHFLIGRPLEALPDPPFTFKSKSIQRRWNLCQTLTHHFWKRCGLWIIMPRGGATAYGSLFVCHSVRRQQR